MTVWGKLLRSAAATRVVELPRRPVAADQAAVADTSRRQRLAAVVAAYHAAAAGPSAGAALVLGWARGGAGAPVEVFTAGGLAGVADGAGTVRMALPPGGVGLRYQPGELYERLRAIPCWTQISVLRDGLLADEPAAEPHEARPSLDEGLLAVWPGAFGWFVLAEPVPAGELAETAATVAAQERMARGRASSPEQAVLAARRQQEHRELRRGESTGMWRLRLFTGGATPAGAAGVAGLLCASADLTGLPYALAPTDTAGSLGEVLSAAGKADEQLGSSLLVASLAVPPIDEVPGVRATLRSEFDVTPETGTTGDGFPFGAVLDRGGAPIGAFRVPAASLNRHTFVCGATGTGKSQTIRALLEVATERRLPWLVVEPAKAEYRRMADRIGGERVIVIRPGDPDAPPAGFNPLRPAPGFPLQTHLDLVRSLCLAAFRAEEPFPQVLSAALTRCYEDLGWDLALGEPRVPGTSPRWPTLGDLQQAAETVVDEIGYGKEVTGNVRGFIRVRLASLRLGTTGRFFEGGHPLDVDALLKRNVVFEIEDVGDDRDKAFLMGALLIQLVEHLRGRDRADPAPSGDELRHLSVFEEAHRLLRRGDDLGPTSRAVEMFASMLAEIRAYGEGLVIAEQIPSKLIPDVIKNTAVKVVHRLPALDDREAVGATINLTDRQSRYLVTLPPGTGAVFADGMDLPVLVQMPDGTSRERGRRTPAAPVDTLIGRRSATCGPDCRATACTLRDMRLAQRLLHDQPWIALWAELSVLGHLTGWPTPVIRAAHMRTLLARRGRLLDCALSHAVDDAVAVRSPALATDPAELAGHVLRTLLGQLAGRNLCSRTEPAYRSASAGRAAWFGTRAPSAIERSVGSTTDAPDWPARVEAALGTHFAGASWPVHYLVGAKS